MSQSISRPKVAQTHKAKSTVAPLSSIYRHCALPTNPAWIDLCANRQKAVEMVRSFGIQIYTSPRWRSCRLGACARSIRPARRSRPESGPIPQPTRTTSRWIRTITIWSILTVKNTDTSVSREQVPVGPTIGLKCVNLLRLSIHVESITEIRIPG